MLRYFLLFWAINYTYSSHYRGGSISWTIRQSDYVNGSSTVPVRVYQRHSWRRSAAPDFWSTPVCTRETIANGSALLGEAYFMCTSLECNTLVSNQYRLIPTQVLCTDFDVQYDYASGENYTILRLPVNQRLFYTFESCCWIGLLPRNLTPGWSLNLIIDTNRRLDGRFNNAPVSTMQPLYAVEIGRVHSINIPMADIDGDRLRCRWGASAAESGGIYLSKGDLQANPCVLTYNATKLGYEGVAVIIEDFGTDNQVLSAIPLQFLIHIVPSQGIITTTLPTGTDGEVYTLDPGASTPPPPCPLPPEYIGDWRPSACVGIPSKNLTTIRIIAQVPCNNSDTSIVDFLTISPAGMVRSNITKDPQRSNRFMMTLQWTPQTTQYGVQQLCVTPRDSNGRTGQTVCFNMLVDVHSPEFVSNSMSPTGTVPQNQSVWTISADVDIVPPSDGNISTLFYKRDSTGFGTDTLVYRVSLLSANYQPRQITFTTEGVLWEEGAEYYILLDGGAVTINQSCGIQSAPIINTYFWTFSVLASPTTVKVASNNTTTTIPEDTTTTIIPEETTMTTTPEAVVSTTITKESTTTTTPEETTTTTTSEKITTTTTPEAVISTTTTKESTTTSRALNQACPESLLFGTIKNVLTSDSQRNYSFCFNVNTTFADVTISANTWTPCSTWKTSGAADPLMDLYKRPNNAVLLAQNDDGLSMPEQNCYAAVISYRLVYGTYLVVIRHPKCNYGRFEVRLSAETTNSDK